MTDGSTGWLIREKAEHFEDLYHPAEDIGYIDAQTANDRREELRQLAAGIASLARYLRES